MDKDQINNLITETVGLFDPETQKRIIKRKRELESMTPETLKNLAKSAMKNEFKAQIQESEEIIEEVMLTDYNKEFYVLSLIKHEQFKFQRELKMKLNGNS